MWLIRHSLAFNTMNPFLHIQIALYKVSFLQHMIKGLSSVDVIISRTAHYVRNVGTDFAG